MTGGCRHVALWGGGVRHTAWIFLRAKGHWGPQDPGAGPRSLLVTLLQMDRK